ncbi:MAG: hypothetical protein AAGB46_07480 [Verrucomicrobiota bacterium]
MTACSEEPQVTQYKEDKPKEETQATPDPMEREASPDIARSAQVQTGEIGFEKPVAWSEGRSSSMRIASYSADVGGDSADISLVKLAGPAGGLLANVNRWRGQVGLGDFDAASLASASESRKTTSGEDYIYVELVNPEGNQAILGGIYERRGFTLFAKYSSTADSVAEGKADFLTFCDSVKF